MSLNECALCNTLITETNNTKEHIVPNSIGGRKKITGFICNSCNNKSGDNWDSELAKQLNPLSLFFGISRERGDVPSQIFETTGGDRLRLNAEGSMGLEKPEYKEFPVDTGLQINIKARTLEEAKKMLAGVKRKYPQVDIDVLLENLKINSFYSPDMLKFNLCFGGQDAGRSLVKSALAVAVNSGINPKDCEQALNYLKNENGEACFGYYYQRDLVVNRPSDTIFHCVAVQGNPETKQILGYVEFYSVQRMVICLSNNYEDKLFFNCYAIDPISGKEFDLEIDLLLPQEEVIAAYKYERIPQGAVEAAFHKVIPLGMKASYEKEKNRVIHQSVEYAFKNCGAKEGEMLTPEHVQKLSSLVMEKLEPFIFHQISESKEE